MSNLVVEMLLRLAKAAVAGLLGALVFAAALALGAAPSVELALVAWLSAAAFVLLVQESPI